MNLSPDLIPNISIVVPYLYVAWMWILFKRSGQRVAHKFYLVFAFAFFMQAALYVFFMLFPYSIEVRGFWIKLSLLDIALCFAIPMTFQYGQRNGN